MPAPSFAEPLKWALFRAMETLSDWRGNVASRQTYANDLTPAKGRPALWVFVSTIGELNATNPFLRALHAQLSDLQLVLITDLEHYRQPYLAQYPDAVVFATSGHSRDARALAEHLPPRMLIIGEIPCLPSDAPCRFSYAFVRAAKHKGATICLVNGWLYHYAPPCRMDALEDRLFRREYARQFDVACVQTAEVRERLIAHGTRAERVHVTGNIKFDAMQRADWRADRARSPALLQSLIDGGRPTIVAGCVTDHAEQGLVLDAFLRLLERHPDARLVLAPRHPEIRDNILALERFLAARQLRAVFRSRIQDAALDTDTQCLVLDTIGELRDFYAASTIAYVGRNHNILEPLAFHKPVVLSPGWEPTYPSFPVYQAMLDAGGILVVENADALGGTWLRLIESSQQARQLRHDLDTAIAHASGAAARCLNAVMPAIRA